MTTHDDHHISNAGDALFDKIIKVVGVVLALIVIAGMAIAFGLVTRSRHSRSWIDAVMLTATGSHDLFLRHIEFGLPLCDANAREALTERWGLLR